MPLLLTLSILAVVTQRSLSAPVNSSLVSE